MIIVNIRKQGGAAIMTIPANVLKLLDLEVGATLELQVVDGGFTARPVRPAGGWLAALSPGRTAARRYAGCHDRAAGG